MAFFIVIAAVFFGVGIESNSLPTKLIVPTATESASEKIIIDCEQEVYTVQENDSLANISERYGTTIDEIKNYNGMLDDTIIAGQKLIIRLCWQKK